MLFLKRGQGRKRVCVTFNQKQRISRVFLHEVEMHLHIFDTFQNDGWSVKYLNVGSNASHPYTNSQKGCKNEPRRKNQRKVCNQLQLEHVVSLGHSYT